MASQTPALQKPSTRWGSFLSSVESRLDTILADEDTAAKNPGKDDGKIKEQPGKRDAMVVPAIGGGSQSRTPSANRAQERLNERLAKALANKNLGKVAADTSATTSKTPSAAVSPVNGSGSPRNSLDIQRQNRPGEGVVQEQSTEALDHSLASENEKPAMNEDDAREQKGLTEVQGLQPTLPTPSIEIDESTEGPEGPRASTDSKSSFSSRPSAELARSVISIGAESPKLNGIANPAVSKSVADYEKILEQIRSDNEAAELRRQEEIHEYLERIDALQAKLQYLTKEAAELAQNAAAEVKSGSLEHKLAKKDEQIALLIEEGQKLSQTELKHMSIIKKLRGKAGEDERAAIEAKKTSEKHQKVAMEERERAKRAEASGKQAVEKVKYLARLEKDLESIRTEKENNDILVRDLQMQLSEATSMAKQAEQKANADALDQERRRAADLTEELSSLRIEKESAEKAHQNQLREMNEKSEREKERARAAQIDRQAELDTLESRLEAYRARAEEASAGQGGDVQTKLLRQIETLQNQYAVASENWQGIEGSLLSRVAALEKERDDIAKREAEVRRKAREMVSLVYYVFLTSTDVLWTTKCRRMEEELERVNARIQDLDHELSSRTTQLSTLQDRFSRAETDVKQARDSLKSEREAWEVQQASRLEEERAKIKEELLRNPSDTLYQHFHTESPVNRTRKSSIAERGSPALSRARNQGITGLGINGHAPDRPLSHRSSDRRAASYSDFPPPARTDSMSTVPQLSVNNGIPETPSIDDSKRDDDGFFDGVATPITPDRATINDLISVSTTGAGPSVQLVERMSAAVRRLESEKASHKDELARIASQRDEAREQVVEMMKEHDEKREREQRLKALEKELGEVNERYLTTLEMLGEKSEKVEELKADVDDLKGMYRELVERTTR